MRNVANLQTWVVLLVLSLVIFALDAFNFLKWPKAAAGYITNPISFGIYRIAQTGSNQFYFIFEARFAAKENKALKEQIGQLISENAGLRTKLSETESQLTQQSALDPKTYSLMAGRPIGLDRFLRIDLGALNGIKPNQAVVFKDNFIGLTVNVSEKSSDVRLLRDPDSKIAAFALDKDGKAKGVLTGQFGQELLFDKVLHGEPVSVGDLVYSEGTEGLLPRGLILGRVTEVIENPNDIFKKAKVVPIFDLRDLELVFVIQ